jgi:hypothetical protein
MTRPPTWFEWLTVAAIISGPILALWVQRALDRLREKKNQRLRLFFGLMTTRATPLAPAHINALNSIDVVFHRAWRDRKVRQAWAKALEHINTNANPTEIQAWADRLNDLKVDLYQAMGQAVGYKYSIDYLKRQVYLPRLFTDSDAESMVIRQTLAKVLTDDGLKVRVMPEPPAPAPQQPPTA